MPRIIAPQPNLVPWEDPETGLVNQIWQDWLDEYVRPGLDGSDGAGVEVRLPTDNYQH